MPPKGWRKYPDGFKPANAAGTPIKEKDTYSLDDLLFAKSTILKLSKEILPDGMTIPKDGQLAITRSASVFVSYLALEANGIANDSSRKTIMPSDVFKALENIELAAFLPKVRSDLAEFEAHTAARKANQKLRAEKGISLEDDENDVDDDEMIIVDPAEKAAQAAAAEAALAAGNNSDSEVSHARTKKRRGSDGGSGTVSSAEGATKNSATAHAPKQRGRKKKNPQLERVELESPSASAKSRANRKPRSAAATDDDETELEDEKESVSKPKKRVPKTTIQSDEEMGDDAEEDEEDEEEEEDNEEDEDEDESEGETDGRRVISGMPEEKELEGAEGPDTETEDSRTGSSKQQPNDDDDDEDEDNEDEDDRLNARR